MMAGVRSLAALTPHPPVPASEPSVTIDKGIPMPNTLAYGRKPGAAYFALRAMDVGDSFVFPPPPSGKVPVIRAATAAVNFASKKTGRTFRCRTVTENGARVVRVWRVA